MTDMTDRQRKRATYHVKQIEHVATVLDTGPSVSGRRMPWFQVFSECVRRGSISAGPDGFAAGGGGAGAKNSISDPTGNMAMARMDRPASDPVGDAIRRVWSRLNEIERLTNELTGDVAFVLTVDEGIRGRVATVDICPICEATITGVGEDRVKRGFCSKCYQAGARERRAAMTNGDQFDWTLWAMRRQDEIRGEVAS